MRFDLSDDEWALLEPLMPKSRKSGRADDRKIMNAIFYVHAHRNAVARSAERYGPYTTAYNRFNRCLGAASGSDFRYARIEVARQSVSDRQHDRESSPCGQRR